MLAKALRSFSGRYGLIRAGMTFNCDPDYFNALKKNGLIALSTEGAPTDPGPSKDRNIPTAPSRSGKDQPGQKANKPGATVPPPVGGKVLTSRSLRQDLASVEKTLPVSEPGAKKIVKPAKVVKTRVIKDKIPPPAG